MTDPRGEVMEAAEVSMDPERQQQLRTVGMVSYILHAVVAIGAVLPGVQASVFLLLVAVLIDLVKRGDAAGTWQASHFSWRLRSVVWGRRAVSADQPLVAFAAGAGLDRLGLDFDLVPLPRVARLGRDECRPCDAALND